MFGMVASTLTRLIGLSAMFCYHSMMLCQSTHVNLTGTPNTGQLHT